ncbi:iron uptake system protein EfeO [Kocuria sp. TGY1127_2]|uniref:iron uptake system protein EfeO n=1 Tax=Kocuria sp. TGY1127_2 TaxID=2711328 RepID=UPI0015C08334|nr:iron uptake system protein EfeO [Kocuria sp. TGY1127_2]
MKNTRYLLAVPAAIAMVISLSACTDNPANSSASSNESTNGGTVQTVKANIANDTCTTDPAKIPAGKVAFEIANNGTTPNEFEVLTENKLQIVSEKENIGPGTTAHMTTALKEGTYYTGCKPNMVGNFVGLAQLDVIPGENVEVAKDVQAAEDHAISNYTSYVKDQTGQLVSATQEFTKAYIAGDDQKAKTLYPLARQHYERIEPTAESFGIKEGGDLDVALDARVQDLSADAHKKPTDPEVLKGWTGWHRIEADLFTDDSAGYKFDTDEDRKRAADELNENTQKLYDLVYGKIDGAKGKFKLELSDVATGASSLLEEVATSKIVGEEETFSHTDTYDFKANVEGAEVAYGNVADLVKDKDPKLAEKIESKFESVKSLINEQSTGKDEGGNTLFKDYSQIAAVQKDAGEAPKDSDYTDLQRKFSDAVNALGEPLSKIAGTILH